MKSPPSLWRFAAAGVAALLITPSLCAQVIAPAVRAATTVDLALQAMAVRPERSGHLAIEAPDIAPAGTVTLRVRSEISGTAWLVALRGRRGQAIPSVPPGPALIEAIPMQAGQVAQAELSLDFQRTGFYTLLAYARGRWYFTEREIKLARPPVDKPRVRHAVQ